MSTKRNLLVATCIALSLATASCSGNTYFGIAKAPKSTESSDPQATNTGTMGNASPVPSPHIEGNEAQLPGQVISMPPVLGLAAAQDVVAVRTKNELSIGSIQQIEDGTATKLPVDETCGQLSASKTSFTLACGDHILLIPGSAPYDPTDLAVEEKFPITSATTLSSGEVFATSKESSQVVVYKDGKRIDSITVQAPTDQIEAVENGDGKDSIVRIWRADTTIQSVDWQNSREGGRLRAGMGVGTISSGADGVVLASDTIGKRLAVYTSEDVVRLHQFGNVDGIPWAVSWSEANHLALVTTTDNNQLHAFSIAQGVPELQTKLSTVPDAQYLTSTASGQVIIGSATGQGLQILSAADLKN